MFPLDSRQVNNALRQLQAVTCGRRSAFRCEIGNVLSLDEFGIGRCFPCIPSDDSRNGVGYTCNGYHVVASVGYWVNIDSSGRINAWKCPYGWCEQSINEDALISMDRNARKVESPLLHSMMKLVATLTYYAYYRKEGWGKDIVRYLLRHFL